MDRLDEADPIWGQPADVYRVGRDDRSINSNRTGNFIAPEGFKVYIRDWSINDRAKISTWILNKNRAGETPTLDPNAMNLIQNTRPMSISEKIDRFLMMLERQGFRAGGLLPWPQMMTMTEEYTNALHSTMLWIEAASDTEFYAFGPILQQAGILHVDKDFCYSLAFGGLKRLEQLRSGGTDSDQVFVAMWFNGETQESYDRGIEPALRRAGYRAQRIDQKEHNNKIDDEIIAEIRRSQFIVADFTCGLIRSGKDTTAVARGGVYYEAGFAQGLGLPVVWTVRADQIDLVHFDTRQFNHIAWQHPVELAEKLYNRVAAVIGVRRQIQ